MHAANDSAAHSAAGAAGLAGDGADDDDDDDGGLVIEDIEGDGSWRR
jgi:hypothetical protein